MLIDRLTKTHADLDAELSRFRRLLQEVIDGNDGAVAALKSELEAVEAKLEQHIASEARLEKRADRVLGEGAMQDYDLGEHQDRLRLATHQLHEALSGEPDVERTTVLFDEFMTQFEEYSQAEWAFLQANASVLYPGGGTDT